MLNSHQHIDVGEHSDAEKGRRHLSLAPQLLDYSNSSGWTPCHADRAHNLVENRNSFSTRINVAENKKRNRETHDKQIGKKDT